LFAHGYLILGVGLGIVVVASPDVVDKEDVDVG
jgi:hypothetical protein